MAWPTMLMLEVEGCGYMEVDRFQVAAGRSAEGEEEAREWGPTGAGFAWQARPC